jgi:hypothetical protein
MENNQSPLRDELKQVLGISFSRLEAAIDYLNCCIKAAVPTPPLFTPPRPKMIAPGWIIGIRRCQVPAISADPYLGAESWLPTDTGVDRNEQIKSHMPRIHAYRVCLLHAMPHLPPPRDWQALIDREMGYDAIGPGYCINKGYSDLVCCSLRWNPLRVRRAVEAIQSLTTWCYRMTEHIDRWCRRQLDQPETAEALQFLRDILVEHTIREGKV